ncbi:SAF domain-containing protein [Aestuariimicrobium soli]|uniref:SAF domain-containing protein n=1 Tax=Aestuariimicrobium soli TaxID=2035834 RepID=UPI003EBAAB0C
MKIARARDSFVSALRWHRRTLAALVAGLAVLGALSVLRPPDPVTAPVVVAAHDLSPGTRLAAADLRIAHVPPEFIPAGAPTTTDEVIGLVLVVPLPGRSVVTTAVTLGTRQTRPGEVLVPFRLSDPSVAALLKVGDLVNVVAQSTDGGSATIATGARVTALMTDEQAAGPLGTGSSSEPGVIVIATDPASAARVAAASSTDGLAVTLGTPR